MIIHRIVELQAKTVIREITDDQSEYEFLENLIEDEKPEFPEFKGYHYLIVTPFRYPLPVPPQFAARFRPPHFHRNCLYACFHLETTIYEYVFHWMSERRHIENLEQETNQRTHFTVAYSDGNAKDVSHKRDVKKIMDRHSYQASHDFILKHPNVSSVHYPSSRDPLQRQCVAVFDIKTLGKNPKNEHALQLTLSKDRERCRVVMPIKLKTFEVKWEDVSC